MPAKDNDERDQLGEALYMKVREIQPDLAGKITGMMLDSLEDSEINDFMDDEAVLREKIAHAVDVLNNNAGGSNGNTEDLKHLKQQNNALKEELQEAEKWAEDMQREWDQKESKFKKEKDALMAKVSAAEARAKVAEAAKVAAAEPKAPANGTDKDKLSAKVEEAEKRSERAEADKLAAEAEVKKLTEQLKSVEKDCAGKLQASSKEASLASEKHRKEVASKDEELKRLKASADELDVAKRKLKEMEAKNQEMEARVEETPKKEKSENRCRELQQEVENAHREIKSLKGQLKGLTAAPNKGAEGKKLSEALNEIADLKKKLKNAGVTVPDSPKKAKSPSAEAATPVAAQPAADPVEVPEPAAEEEQAEEEEQQEEAPEPEEEEEQEPEEEVTPSVSKSSAPAKTVPDAKGKAQLTSSGKSSKKKGGGAVPASPASSAAVAKKKDSKSSFKCSGAHVVAGCLAVVVMIQLGLFVHEGWFAEQTGFQ